MPVPRQDYPAYAKTDLRAGVHYDTWTLNLYANNAHGSTRPADGWRWLYAAFRLSDIQPRTVGLWVAKAF